jgi:polysaccharide export outer membrane protein
MHLSSRSLSLAVLLVSAVFAAIGCKNPPPPNPEAFFQPRIVDEMEHQLQVGDILDFIYTIGPQPISAAGGYRIQVGDELSVEFAFTQELNRRVRVRPDGMVTLPIIGEVQAFDRSPSGLAEDLRELYQDHLRDPLITVDVPRYTSLAETISRAIVNADGTSRQFIYPVRPDGMVSLPSIGDVRAFGRSVEELDLAIREAYAAIGHPEIEVTPVLRETGAQQVYVTGEVNREGIFPMNGDVTVLHALAMAGGTNDRANERSIMVLRRMPDGSTQGHRVDIRAALRENDYTQNVYLRPYDMIYVPRTFITDVNIWTEQFMTRGIYAMFDRPLDLWIGLEIADQN